MEFANDPDDYVFMDRVLSRIIERGLTFRYLLYCSMTAYNLSICHF